MHRLRNAIDHAITHNCDVISISLGGTPSNAVKKAMGRAKEAGMIVLAAAGNEVNVVVWPARYRDVIAVAGCNIQRQEWSGSCRGPAVDISAPGESVWCARNKDGVESTDRGNGTSFAVATVAGIAALWVGHHGKQLLVDRYGAPNIVTVFRQILKQTASQDHNLPTGFGAGIVDALAILQAELPDPADVTAMVVQEDDMPMDDVLQGQGLNLTPEQLERLTSSNRQELVSGILLQTASRQGRFAQIRQQNYQGFSEHLQAILQ